MEPDDAADLKPVGTEIFYPSAGRQSVHTETAPCLCKFFFPRLCCRGQRRNPAVGRIGDERRALRLLNLVTGVEPELVVVADDVGRRPAVASLLVRQLCLFELSGFLGSEHLLARELLRPLER